MWWTTILTCTNSDNGTLVLLFPIQNKDLSQSKEILGQITLESLVFHAKAMGLSYIKSGDNRFAMGIVIGKRH